MCPLSTKLFDLCWAVTQSREAANRRMLDLQAKTHQLEIDIETNRIARGRRRLLIAVISLSSRTSGPEERVGRENGQNASACPGDAECLPDRHGDTAEGRCGDGAATTPQGGTAGRLNCRCEACLSVADCFALISSTVALHTLTLWIKPSFFVLGQVAGGVACRSARRGSSSATYVTTSTSAAAHAATDSQASGSHQGQAQEEACTQDRRIVAQQEP